MENHLGKYGRIKMRILVTGHNGYIVSIMMSMLKEVGHEAVGIDSYYFADCSLFDTTDNFLAFKKDIRDLNIGDLTGFDAVIHLAALCNDNLGDLNPELTYNINYKASVHLARLAKDAGVERFLYSSSCSMYGAASSEDILEESAPLNPITPYAISKVKAEEDISKLADDHFCPVFMRNATAYGVSPRLRGDIVLNNLAAWAFTTGKIKIMSDGTPWRPIVHIRDICNAFIAVLNAPKSVIHNQAFNIGVNEENYQVKDLAEIVKQVIPNCEIEYSGEGKPDPRNYRVSFDKLQKNIPEFTSKWTAYQGACELYQVFQKIGFSKTDLEGDKFIRLSKLKFLLQNNYLTKELFWLN